MPSSPHLQDPVLAPFLSPRFSTASYLNENLPSLLPPSTLSNRRPAHAEPLSVLSSKATTLLSTLDLHTNRLLTVLQTLTDEILRVGPRLGYEVDLLRSDVVALGESLDSSVAPEMSKFEEKPKDLERLEMLANVRERLEEVVKIFGDAMDWSIDAPDSEQQKDDIEKKAEEMGYTPPVAPVGLGLSPQPAGKGSGKNPTEEILYLIASEEFEEAARRVGRLRELARVFENTVEGPARTAVVDALEDRVKTAAEKAVKKEELVSVREAQRTQELKKEEDATSGQGWGSGKDGYYGLINQFSRMRSGMS